MENISDKSIVNQLWYLVVKLDVYYLEGLDW